MKNHIFLYTPICLDPNIEISNIAAFSCPIFMILGSLDLSKFALAKSSARRPSVLQVNYFHFQGHIQRTTQGQTQCCLRSIKLYLFHDMVLGLTGNSCTRILCMSPIQLHVILSRCSSHVGGGEIAQSLASLSIKRTARVRSWLDLLVIERWNSITVLLTCSHQCRLTG